MDPTTAPAAPAPPTTAENLEAVVLSGIETPSSESPGRDLMTDFIETLTDDLPVQAPGEPTPKAKAPESEPEPKKKAEPEAKEPESEPEPGENEDLPELPKNASPKARESWDKLRARGDKYKAEVTEKAKELAAREERLRAVEAELNELKGKAAKLPEYEERLKDLDEYEKELTITRLEATREYKEAITKPFQVLTNTIETLAKSNDENAVDDVFRMVEEADPAKQRQAFKNLTAGWDEVDRAELWAAVKDARVLFDKQASMKANAAAAAKEREALAARKEAEAKEEARKQFKTASEGVIKDLRGKLPFVPIAEGETEDDRYLRLSEKLANVDFDAQSPRGKALAAAAALEIPNLIKSINRLKAENQELLARVGKANAAKPKVSVSEPDAPKDDDNLFDFDEPATRFLSHSIPVVAGD